MNYFPTPVNGVWTFQHNNKVYLLRSFEAPARDFRTIKKQGA